MAPRRRSGRQGRRHKGEKTCDAAMAGANQPEATAAASAPSPVRVPGAGGLKKGGLRPWWQQQRASAAFGRDGGSSSLRLEARHLAALECRLRPGWQASAAFGRGASARCARPPVASLVQLAVARRGTK